MSSDYSTPANTQYHLNELTQLLNQSQVDPLLLTESWVSQFELTQIKADRAVMRILVGMLERAKERLPFELQIYLLYGQGIIATSDEQIESGYDFFQQALARLNSNHASTASLPVSLSTSNELSFLPTQFITPNSDVNPTPLRQSRELRPGHQTPRLQLLEALLKIQLAMVLLNQDKLSEVETIFTACLATVQLYQHRRAEGVIWLNLSNIANKKGQPAQALTFALTALTIFEQISDQLKQADCLTRLADYYGYQNRYKEALASIEKCIAIRSIASNKRDLGAAYLVQFSLYYRWRRYREGIESLEMAALLFKQVNRPANLAIVYTNIGISYFEMNNDAKAIESARASLVELEQIQLTESSSYAVGLSILAKSTARLGDFKTAHQSIQQVEQMLVQFNQSGNVLNLGVLHSHLGQAYLLVAKELSQYQTAFKYYNQSVEQFVKMGDEDTHRIILDVYTRLILSKPLLKKSSLDAEVVIQLLEQIVESWLALWLEQVESETHTPSQEPSPTNSSSLFQQLSDPSQTRKQAEWEQVLKCAEWLNAINKPLRSYEVYKWALQHAGEEDASVNNVQQSKLSRAELYLKIAQVAPPEARKDWLERSLILFKEGKGATSVQRYKEVLKLLKLKKER